MDEVIIGGYKRVNIIQTGQNSEVWEVTDGEARMRYTMKLLLPEKNDDREQRGMLRHEARVAMSLDHPKIIKFFKYSNDRRNPFILMEYFPSQNLKLRILRNQYESFIKPNLRVILEQTASAISFMHSKKWVHRDIKPDNILVSNGVQARLIDFALAVRVATGFSRLFARRGRTAGTRSYMSPEQVRGLPLDGRADIYSLGIMIYEIVAGRLPFVGRSGGELLSKHLHEAPPPIDPARNVTPEFTQLILKMLAKKATDRIPNLDEFNNRLRTIKMFKDETAATPATL